MKELIVRDDRELRRLEAAIATIRTDTAGVRCSRLSLLAALEAERTELLRARHGRRATRIAA